MTDASGRVLIPPPSPRSIPSPHDLPAPAGQTTDLPPACAAENRDAASRQNEVARQAGREVGRVRERGFQKSATIRWNEPLSPALSSLVPRRERGHFSDGGCIKMRPARPEFPEFPCVAAADLFCFQGFENLT